MKSLLLVRLAVFLVANPSTSVSGFKIPFKRTVLKGAVAIDAAVGASLAAAAGQDVGNIAGIRYTTNITINGKEVHVALDTGSTDLWVIPPGGIGQFNDTGISLGLRYGDGSYGVEGTIGVAPFGFGPYKIGKQAFLSAHKSTIGSLTELGIYGLFGLGFDDPRTSPINTAISKKYGYTATWGASVLENIFKQDPAKPNFIGVDLARTEDLEATAGGSFTIGEYDEDYAAVANTQKLPQYPPGGSRWTTLFDGILVNGYAINVQSTISGVPHGKAVALVDTGSPRGKLPSHIMKGIFSVVPGSAFDPDSQYWIVPCTGTPLVEFVIGGHPFPLHPLDLTELTPVTIGGQNYTACIGSFSTDEGVGGDEFDLVLGDTFLRNVYSVYDFGDYVGEGLPSNGAYIQFLSQVNPHEAAKQHLATRTKALSMMPPEIPPNELVSYLQGKPSASMAHNAASTSSVKTNARVATSGYQDYNTDSAIKKYAPAVIGLLAANLIVGMVLVILSAIGYVHRGKARGPVKRTVDTQYVPVKLKEDDTGCDLGSHQNP